MPESGQDWRNKANKTYIDLIFESSRKWATTYPSRVQIGDYGLIDKETNEFIMRGNIYKDQKILAIIPELSTNDEWKPQTSGEQEQSIIISKNNVTMEDLGSNEEATLRFRFKFNQGLIFDAFLIMYCPKSLDIPKHVKDLAKLRDLPELKGMQLITGAMTCPAYSLYFSYSQGETVTITLKNRSRTILSVFGNRSRSKAWTVDGAVRLHYKDGYNPTEDYEYTPLFSLMDINGSGSDELSPDIKARDLGRRINLPPFPSEPNKLLPDIKARELGRRINLPPFPSEPKATHNRNVGKPMQKIPEPSRTMNVKQISRIPETEEVPDIEENDVPDVEEEVPDVLVNIPLNPHPAPIVPRSVNWKSIDENTLDSILDSPPGRHSLFQQKGDDAIAIADVLDQVIGNEGVNPHKRKRYSKALSRLCGNSGILPTSHTIAGALELESDHPVARGGFGEVWKGRYKNRTVAIKVMKLVPLRELEKMRKMFCKEAVIWKHLSHPNVLPFLGVATSPFPFCMVAPWMALGNIVQYLKSHPRANRLLLLLDVAQGLKYLHYNDLVHADLKGVNILMTDENRACLADFGLSHLVSESINGLTVSEPTSKGTVRWMAPELLVPDEKSQKTCSPTKKSDIYAFGMVIYEVMTGLNPFGSLSSYYTIVTRIASGCRPERPPKGSVAAARLTDDIWNVVERCWCQKPDDRLVIDKVLDLLNTASRFWDPYASAPA